MSADALEGQMYWITLGTGVIGSGSDLIWVLKSYPSSLEVWSVFVTAEPSHQPRQCHLFCICTFRSMVGMSVVCFIDFCVNF